MEFIPKPQLGLLLQREDFLSTKKYSLTRPISSDGIQGVRTGSCEPVLGVS